MSRLSFQGGRVLLWLGVITLLLYVNTLRNGFVWDDRAMILFPVATTNAGIGPNLVQGNTIPLRPVSRFSFYLDRLLYAKNPAGFHLTNLLLHLGVILVFAIVARGLLASSSSAFLATALLALHPVHSETVAALLGRSDLLVCLFSLLGLWAYRKSSLPFSLGLGFLCSLLAMASKESGLATVGLLIWYDLCFRRKEGKRLLIRWIPLVCLAVAAILVYVQLRGPNIWPAGSAIKWWGGSRYHTFLMMLTVVWEYTRLLCFPASLSPWYVTPVATSLFHGKAIAGLVVLTGALVLLIVSFLRRPALSFGLGWILVFLAPVSNLVPIPGSMMAERWLYVPSLGFCLLLGMALNGVWTKALVPHGKALKAGAVAAGLMLVFLMGWQTVRSNAVWQDDETLFRRVIARFPDSFKGHANLGKVLLDQGRVAEAKSELQKTVALKADSPFPYYWLGEAYQSEGRADSAQVFFHEAIRRDSTFTPAYLELGGLDRQIGKPDSALTLYRQGLRHIRSPELYNNVGLILVGRDSLQGGIRAYEQALQTDPEYAPAYHNMGNAYRAQGYFSRAEAAYRKALETDPGLAEAHHALALLYESQGRWPEAVRELEAAVKGRPRELVFELTLARAYASSGDLARAIGTYDHILGSNPSLSALAVERDSLMALLSKQRP